MSFFATTASRLFVSATLGTVLLASVATAEPVRHTFTGTVTIVSDGVGGTLDLTGTFSSGQSVTIAIEIERSTKGIPIDPSVYYVDAVTALAFSVGSYTRPHGPPATTSGIVVADDADTAPPELTGSGRVAAGTLIDYMNVVIPSPGSPPIGSAIATALVLDILDDEAQAFSSDALPRTITMDDFETTLWQIQFVDGSTVGFVNGTFDDVTTPAAASTWGRVKSSYRN